MRIWKWVGLAGVVGAAAVGIAVGTSVSRRKRREYLDANSDELRIRLRQRLDQAQARRASCRPSQLDGRSRAPLLTQIRPS